MSEHCDHKFVDSTVCLKCGWSPSDALSVSRAPQEQDGSMVSAEYQNKAARLPIEGAKNGASIEPSSSSGRAAAEPLDLEAMRLRRWRNAALLKDRTRRAIRDRKRAGESVDDLADDYYVPSEFVEAICSWELFGDDSDRAEVERLTAERGEQGPEPISQRVRAVQAEAEAEQLRSDKAKLLAECAILTAEIRKAIGFLEELDWLNIDKDIRRHVVISDLREALAPLSMTPQA